MCLKNRNSGRKRRNRQNSGRRGKFSRKKNGIPAEFCQKKTEIFKSNYLLWFFEFQPKTMHKNYTGFRRNSSNSGGFRPEFRLEFGKRSAEFQANSGEYNGKERRSILNVFKIFELTQVNPS